MPATYPYPEPARSSPYPPPYFLKFRLNIILPSSLCSSLHFPVTSSLLRPNILLNILFFNILSLRSSLHVSDQVELIIPLSYSKHNNNL